MTVVKEEVFILTDPWKLEACHAMQGPAGEAAG